MTKIYFSNSLTRKKEEFIPIETLHVKMYACGPTVYERPHLGNARAAVVYDILYRLLNMIYDKVTYVRNITDVDDKIINAANTKSITIQDLTSQTIDYYHQDIAAINCLPPTIEPRATDHILQMIEMISRLISLGHAYEVEGHVLFDIASYKHYGELAGRSQDEMIAGARVEVAPFKKNPGDFILWKPAKVGEEDCSFVSPWGKGRPGWHIECSAMSFKHLGVNFDIHGGGADLMFPHHENEIAQSRCAAPGSRFANYWIHNGFLTVYGEKMSKSLGNFKTVRELIEGGIDGSVIRYFYLTAHYKKPLDLTEKALEDARKSMHKLSNALDKVQDDTLPQQSDEILNYLCDDMNTAGAIAHLQMLASKVSQGDVFYAPQMVWGMNLLGLKPLVNQTIIPDEIKKLADDRLEAKKNKNWSLADELRARIERGGYRILDEANSYRLERIIL